jgi:hypothetical protein
MGEENKEETVSPFFQEECRPKIQWVVPGIVATSPRPGYPDRFVEKQTVEIWLQNLKKEKIQSILCLLSEMEMGYYRKIPGGLISFYKEKGFSVMHFPVSDPRFYLVGWEEIHTKEEEIVKAFLSLPKPVLIHCSAGVDRTGEAVRFLKEKGIL